MPVGPDDRLLPADAAVFDRGCRVFERPEPARPRVLQSGRPDGGLGAVRSVPVSVETGSVSRHHPEPDRKDICDLGLFVPEPDHRERDRNIPERVLYGRERPDLPHIGNGDGGRCGNGCRSEIHPHGQHGADQPQGVDGLKWFLLLRQSCPEHIHRESDASGVCL